MKKILLFIFFTLSITAFSQILPQEYTIEKVLRLQTVNLGSKSDSVLVRGSDKKVKFIPRSEFGADQNLDQVLSVENTANDKFIVFKNSSANNPVDISQSSDGSFLVRGSQRVYGTSEASMFNANTQINTPSMNIGNTSGTYLNFGSNYLSPSHDFNIYTGNDFRLYAKTAQFTVSGLTGQTTYKLPEKDSGVETFAMLSDITNGGGSQNLEDVLTKNGEAFLGNGTSQTDVILTATDDKSTIVLSGAKGSDVTTFSIDNGEFSLRNKKTGYGYNTLKFDVNPENSPSDDVNILIPSKMYPGNYTLVTQDQLNLDYILRQSTEVNNRGVTFYDGSGNSLSLSPNGDVTSYTYEGTDSYIGVLSGVKNRFYSPDAIIYVDMKRATTGEVTFKYPEVPASVTAYTISLNQVYTNPSSTALSSATLNTTYSNALVGDKVQCTSITGGGIIYEKTASGWSQYSVTAAP